jgi:hypothetical protein
MKYSGWSFFIALLIALPLALRADVKPYSTCTCSHMVDGVVIPDSVISVDNEYVRVLHNFAAATKAMPKEFGTRIIVALNDVKCACSRGELALQRGGVAVFKTNESYDAPQGEFFEVAIKANHPPWKSPEQWIDPQKNVAIYEDRELRISEERLDVGDDRPLHSHPQRVVVRLNETRLTDPRYAKKERPGAGLQVPNTARFAEPLVHVVRNLGPSPLFNILIEFKVPH